MARVRVDARGRAWVAATVFPSTPVGGSDARSVEVELLLDTGADRSCVAERHLLVVGSAPHDRRHVRDFLGRVVEVDLHLIWLDVGLRSRKFLSVALIPTPASEQGDGDGLLGLDALDGLVFRYDRRAGTASLARARAATRRRR